MNKYIAALCMLLLVVSAFAADTDAKDGYPENKYTPPAGFTTYQIGVWSSVMLTVIVAVASYAVAGIDYSGDTLLLSTDVGGHME